MSYFGLSNSFVFQSQTNKKANLKYIDRYSFTIIIALHYKL